jgi:predicted metal-dependent peptidase
MTDSGAIEKKLTAARTWLVIDKPFLGALVLRLPMVAADPKWCPSIATDARSIFYNPAYIDGLDLEQTKFILAHGALHAALTHFNRRGHRDQCRWDIATDYAINPLLVSDGLKPPPGALLMESFEGMTAEEIYPYIKENSDEEPLDQHVYDQKPPDSPPPPRDSARGESGGAPPPKQDTSGNGQHDADPQGGGATRPPPLSQSERESLAVQWQQRLAGAAQQALQAGKLKGSMARLVDHLLQPQLPWRMLLARYMTAISRDDYSYMRPNRREGAAILPSLRSQHIDIAIVLDTSGSITDDEMDEFLSEVNAIKGQLGARITLHACDEALAEDGPWIYEPWEALRLPETLPGGGGTRFTPAIDWAARADRPYDLLLYFTDADGEFPEREPPFPVLWLVKGKHPVPWGQRVQLN